jgi:hypothetical protein
MLSRPSVASPAAAKLAFGPNDMDRRRLSLSDLARLSRAWMESSERSRTPFESSFCSRFDESVSAVLLQKIKF